MGEFLCQKCREPIRIDDSLLEVDEKFINHKKPIKGVKVTKATATSDRGLQDKGLLLYRRNGSLGV